MARHQSPLIGPDVVLVESTEDLIAESAGHGEFMPNEDAVAKPRARRKKKAFVDEAEAELAMDLYNGHADFLVRTAVIRSADYNPRKAVKVAMPEDVARLAAHLRYADAEHFVVVCVDGQMNLRAIHEAHIGGSSSVPIELKHVLKVALLTSSTGVFYCHNHPSGRSELSADDVATTKRIAAGCECIGVKLLDHVVIGRTGRGWASYFEQTGESP